MDYVLVVIGLTGLFFGGEALVRGAVGLARRFRIPPLLIGLTVVGFGTSMPELLVSVDAALSGRPDIALGNVVGSNIGNVLLIIGLTALIWPIRVAGATLRRDTAVMMLSAIALMIPFAMGDIGRLMGMGLLAGLAGYVVWAYRSARGEEHHDDIPATTTLWSSLVWLAVGLTALVIGAQCLVEGAVNLARAHGVSEAFIGLTIVAIGTSLPELATCLVAAFRRHSEIAIGNVVGSNIFNSLGILGVAAIVSPLPVAPRFMTFDLPVMIAVSVLLAALLLSRPSIGRLSGLLLLIAYGLYIWAARG